MFSHRHHWFATAALLSALVGACSAGGDLSGSSETENEPNGTDAPDEIVGAPGAATGVDDGSDVTPEDQGVQDTLSTTWWSQTPSLSIGSTTVNVRNKGALGNGKKDDTAAFQAAINSLPASGGTVMVPAGNYMINALTAINLRSHVRIQMDPLAKLIAIANSSERSWVIKVSQVNNVEITGGAIVGERTNHVGTTGEWAWASTSSRRPRSSCTT
jgi:hypothetical protein